MNIKKKYLFSAFSFVLIAALLLTTAGCKRKIPTGSDFEDVVYTMEVERSASSSSAQPSSRSDSTAPSQSRASVSSSAGASSAASSEEAEEEKNPQYVENWPVLKNANGFNINSVTDINKFGCTDGRVTVADFLPNVAYLENGVAKDIMFNGFAFMPSPNFVNDYGGTGDENEKPMTKDDWYHFIHRLEFRKDYNVDALENATGQVKKALNMPDYKVGVFLSIMKPVSSVENWGEINGKTISLKTDEGKTEALKWMVDESIKVFNDRHYKHLELCGFYYYQEYVYPESKPFLNAITDYIRSKKCITIWVPFFGARGYSDWRDFGFDRASLQANYFPGATLPNGGGIDRLQKTAIISDRNAMGYEMELASMNQDSITGFKEYMKASVNYDFLKKYHTFWIMGGPSTIKNLYRSKDSYTHSTYRELYLFLRRKLTLSSITEKS